jgi:hypothetical protein
MFNRPESTPSPKVSFRLRQLALIASFGTAASGCVALNFDRPHPSTTFRDAGSHMSEQHRAAIGRVALRASEARPSLVVGGDDYGKQGGEVSGGVAAGVQITGQMVAEDPRAIILAPIVLPVAMIAGAITGGVVAEMREARKDLADELMKDNSRPLPSEVLVNELHSQLTKVAGIKSTIVPTQASLPDDADAILVAEVRRLTVTIEGGDAIMDIEAVAHLRRDPGGPILYSQSYSVEDRDSLRDWTRNDNALWDDYVESARRKIAQRISEDFFQQVQLRHVLRPVYNESYRGRPQGDYSSVSVQTLTPTLAWELILLGGDQYIENVDEVDEAKAKYSLEIYEANRLVYDAEAIPSTSHTVQEALQPCLSYRWSVRPTYEVSGNKRVGEWMTNKPKAVMFETPKGRDNFPLIKTPCS